MSWGLLITMWSQCVPTEGREQALSSQRAWDVQVLLRDGENSQQVLSWRQKNRIWMDEVDDGKLHSDW